MIKFKRLHLTPEKFVYLWARIKELERWTLNDDVKTPDALWDGFARSDSLHWEVVENDQIIGFATLTSITDWSGVAHITFFDKRLRGREEQTKDFLKYLFKDLNLQILHAYFPQTHRATRTWLLRMGWTCDGVIKRAIRRNGQLVDMLIMSLTREGGINGLRQKRFEASCQPATANNIESPSGGDTERPREVFVQQNGAGTPTILRRLSRWWSEAVSKHSHEFDGRASL